MSLVTEAINVPKVELTDEEIFAAHLGGKLSVESTAPLDTQRALSIAYTPGVAQVSRAIAADETLADRYTWTDRLVVVVTDGTAVLGLGDIGPRASLPVMEGKSALFKNFAGLNSIPLVLDTKDPRRDRRDARPAAARASARSTSRTSRRRAASRSRSASSKPSTARSCTTISTAPPSSSSLRSTAPRRFRAASIVRTEGRRLRSRRSGRRLREHPACWPASPTSWCWTRRDRLRRSLDLNERQGDLAARTNPRALSGGAAEALAGADVFLGLSAGKIDEGSSLRWPRTRSCSRCPTPTRRSTRRWRKSTPPSSRPDAAISRTRSTMFSPSPVCSRARSTPVPAESPKA